MLRNSCILYLIIHYVTVEKLVFYWFIKEYNLGNNNLDQNLFF